MAKLNKKQLECLGVRLARYRRLKDTLHQRKLIVKQQLGSELGRPGCLAAAATAGYLYGSGGAQSAMREEHRQLLASLSEEVENAARRGAQEGGGEASQSRNGSSSALDFLVSLATTTAVRLASSWVVERVNSEGAQERGKASDQNPSQ